jgi:hypothetical protein
MENKNLVSVLPHGSGIDYDWEFSVESGDTVIAKNGWHYMNPNGFYLGCIEFSIRLHTDGTFDRPEMPNPEQFAHTELARDIAICYYEKDDVSYNEIVDAIWSELECISDVIYSSFESVNSNELADAVKDYIKEESELEFEVPGFWGFYNTNYTYNGDLEYMFFNDPDSLDKKTKELYQRFIDYEMDWQIDQDFIENVCKAYVDSFNNTMSEVLPHWNPATFNLCCMPKYYNYESDRCFAKSVFSNDVIDDIETYLKNHRDNFIEYLRNRFTSYDGYFSNYSNRIEDWEIPIYKMDYNELGAVIHFIMKDSGVNVDAINCDALEQLEDNGESYEYYITRKNQAKLDTYIKENGGTIED